MIERRRDRGFGRGAGALLTLGALLAGGCAATPGEGAGVDEYAQRRAEAIRLVDEAQRLADAGKTDQAIEAYQRSISRSATIAVAWNNLGELYLREQRFADAVSAFERAGELEPTDPRPPYNAGVVYQQKGWANDALGRFDQSLERDPAYLPALRGAVRAAEMLNRSDRATLERIKRATLTETDPAWAEYFERQRFRVENGLYLQEQEG